MLHNKQEFDLEAFIPHETESENEAYQKLQRTAKDWESWIMKAKHLSSMDSDDKEKTVRAVEWFKAGACYTTETDLLFPGPQSQEIAGIHQVFRGLLDRIAGCRKHLRSRTHSNPGGFLFVMFDHDFKLAFEVKSFGRTKQGHDSLQQESCEQILGRLARDVNESFNLYGIGTGTFATGMKCTLAYITVYKLELRMKEATESDFQVASLVLYKSKPLPLMTQECFKKWAGSRQYADVQEKFYNQNGGVDEQGIPRGIRFLWEMMSKRRANFFGPDYGFLFKQGEKVDELLGTGGGFSVVMGLSRDSNSVLKVSTLPVAGLIQLEKDALESLGRKKPELDEIGLPILKEETKISVRLGGIDKEIHGLVLQPRGQPILSAIFSTNFCRV